MESVAPCVWRWGFVMVGEEAEYRFERVRRHRLIAVSLVAVMVLSGLTAFVLIASGPAAAAAPFRSLRIGINPLVITTLNPLKITLADEYVVVYNVYSTLITYDKTYHAIPDLATHWTLASDNRTWTFDLVQDAYFTSPLGPGDRSHPVTADDVVYSFQLQNVTKGSILHSYTSAITSVTKTGPYQVQIVTNGPFAGMYSAASAIPILPQYIWSGYAKPLNAPIKYPVGSGAMYYDYTNTTTTTLVLRKNPNYYGLQYYCQESRPDEVRFISYSGSTTMVNDFLTGATTLDALIGIDPSDYQVGLSTWNPKWAVSLGFVGEISINVITPALAAAYGYTYTANPVLLNDTFRHAVAMSIDKQKLVNDALLGYGNAADTLVPDVNPWHYSIPPNQQYQFNPAAARAMLNSQGWKYDASGALSPGATPLYQKGATNNTVYWPLQIRFYTLNTRPQWEIAARDIVAWLAQAGIQTMDSHSRTSPGYGLYNINQMSGYWLTADYDMWLWDWIFTPASDPSLDVLEVETTGAIGPTNDNYYSNATFDALYTQSLLTVDPAARRVITDEMQRMLYDYHSYILPYYRKDLYAAATPPSARTQASPPDPGWTNWGNWSSEQGLVPDSDLPAPWFQVSPLDNQAPVVASFPGVQWISGSPVSVSVSANDPEGAALGYTWDFGDGTAVQTSTSGSTTHTFAQPGNYTVHVRIKDSEWTTCASAAATIVAGGGPGANLPPQIKGLDYRLSHSTFGLPGETITFNLTANDTEGDPLYITWDFGDGSGVAVNYLTNTQSDRTATQKLTYAATGTYNLSVVVTDNQTGILNHHPSVTPQIVIQTISTPGGSIPTSSNPWINYGIPLGIVAAIVVVALAVFLRRRKERKKDEAEDRMAGGPPPGPPPPPPPP